MANRIKKQLKKIGRYTWELYKGSILPTLMYLCAGVILMMLVMKGDKVTWTGTKIAWTALCLIGATAYHAFAAWATGGNQYEMLVSGNVKRSSMDGYGNEFRMSNHKIAKEYRPWKGFVSGAFCALLPLLFAILFECNRGEIHAVNSEEMSKGTAVLLLLSFLLSGWTIIPFYCMNAAGMTVSYLLSLLFALIPIGVGGGMYIAGAYSRRNKAIREQIIAERMAKAEEERRANKKINYGGLPGTKPKKRK